MSCAPTTTNTTTKPPAFETFSVMDAVLTIAVSLPEWDPDGFTTAEICGWGDVTVQMRDEVPARALAGHLGFPEVRRRTEEGTDPGTTFYSIRWEGVLDGHRVSVVAAWSSPDETAPAA